MTSVLTIGIIAGASLLGWHMWLMFKSGALGRGRDWTTCPCGHAASWHAHEGGDAHDAGCRIKPVGARDIYGYCTCPRTHDEVLAGGVEVPA